MTEIKVSGMTCDHCVRAVNDELSQVPGVSDISVALNPDGVSLVSFSTTDAVNDSAIAAAIDEAGYSLAE